MASFCRSAAFAAVRSASVRSKSAAPKCISRCGPAVPLLPKSTRVLAASVESLMPLHSAIASARLRSFIAADSSCWSSLSQGLKKEK